MVHAISLWIIMFSLWVALSGHMDIPMLSIGALCSLFVVLVSMRMDHVDHDPHLLKITWRILRYWPWLACKIVQANLDVARHILRPRLTITPTLVHITSHQKTDLGRVAYANSITLSPGTVTMDIRGNEFYVHALSEKVAAELQQGEMDRRVSRLERP